ncbi:Hypothetical_protein [Hexamita inflata]|uniref:Hypothetical_protein n=1 Tax=Hexamita inflata TaxID=28002 RepID=A0AA86Q0W1_9EUKA|nr:Hypothetical protein HINF_LOCUS37684 [Hexamita inflata]
MFEQNISALIGAIFAKLVTINSSTLQKCNISGASNVAILGGSAINSQITIVDLLQNFNNIQAISSSAYSSSCISNVYNSKFSIINLLISNTIVNTQSQVSQAISAGISAILYNTQLIIQNSELKSSNINAFSQQLSISAGYIAYTNYSNITLQVSVQSTFVQASSQQSYAGGISGIFDYTNVTMNYINISNTKVGVTNLDNASAGTGVSGGVITQSYHSNISVSANIYISNISSICSQIAISGGVIGNSSNSTSICFQIEINNCLISSYSVNFVSFSAGIQGYNNQSINQYTKIIVFNSTANASTQIHNAYSSGISCQVLRTTEYFTEIILQNSQILTCSDSNQFGTAVGGIQARSESSYAFITNVNILSSNINTMNKFGLGSQLVGCIVQWWALEMLF